MVDTVNLLAAYIGGPAAHADWLGPKVGGTWRRFCIHRVNSHNGSALMTALEISSWLLLLLLHDIFPHRLVCVYLDSSV